MCWQRVPCTPPTCAAAPPALRSGARPQALRAQPARRRRAGHARGGDPHLRLHAAPALVRDAARGAGGRCDPRGARRLAAVQPVVRNCRVRQLEAGCARGAAECDQASEQTRPPLPPDAAKTGAHAPTNSDMIRGTRSLVGGRQHYPSRRAEDRCAVPQALEAQPGARGPRHTSPPPCERT